MKGLSTTSIVISVLVFFSLILGIASYFLINKNSFIKDSFTNTPIPIPSEVTPSPPPVSEMEQEINAIQIESQETELNQLEVDATSL